MCTVTYLPTNNGIILSSNRDESPKRSETPLVTEAIKDLMILYPRDSKGGSWLFGSDHGQALCVLNGAHLKHDHLPPYRKSRGLLAREFFAHDCARAFMQHVDLKGIEPFTMIIYDAGALYVFRWDEKDKYIDILDSEKAHIWSSSTLYNPDRVKDRSEIFYQMMEDVKRNTLLDKIKYIHRNGNVGDPTQNYVMNRENLVRTVSISHLVITGNEVKFLFENILNGSMEERSIIIS